MYLCIDSTERNFHHLILFQKQGVKEMEYHDKQLLECVENFLQLEKIRKEDLRGIAVVVGSGSFSSVRGAVTLANTWHFVLHIPIIGIKKEDMGSTQEWVKMLDQAKTDEYILPTYGGAPNIGGL